MDFDEAIIAHLYWKAKLRIYIIRRDNSIDYRTITREDQCSLGKWMKDEAGNYKHLPEFHALKNEHTKFHRLTALIVNLVNSRQITEAEEMLKPEGEFVQTAAKCVKLITQLKHKLMQE